VLTNTTVLTTINLSPGNAVGVSGHLSGTWTSNNLYVVNGDIIIDLGNSLTIQPGTTIKFNDKYTLCAKGNLIAIGNSNNPITFSSFKNQPKEGDWAGIQLLSSQSNIQNCIIEYSMYGIRAEDCSPPIFFNEIRTVSAHGIYLTNSSSLVKQNKIHDFNTQYASGIISEPTNATSSPTLECNEIYDGYGRGIQFQKGGLIKNNVIYGVDGSDRGYGIKCDYASSCLIENNFIHDCNKGISIGYPILPVPTPTIINNTLNSNTIGIALEENYSSGTIINNIIVNNIIGIDQSYFANTPNAVNHNLVWNNSTGNYSKLQIVGIGQLVNTNINGDQIDSYFNLSKDPLFGNNTSPYYSSSSPCINSGDANYSTNIGCNPSAMCSGMVLGVKENKNISRFGAFPNPFVSVITLINPNADKISSVKFLDITSKEYSASVERTSNFSVNIEKENLTPGIYFLEIMFSNSSKEYIRVIKQ